MISVSESKPQGGAPDEGAVAPTTDEAVEATAVECAPPPAHPRGGRDGGAYERNQKALMFIGIAILAIIVIASSFALGYTIGNQSADNRPLIGTRSAERFGAGQGPGAGILPGRKVRERVAEMLDSGEASLITGTVRAVQDGNVTVETPGGDQTVSVAADTRYLGAGAGAAGAGGGKAAELKTGEQVQVLARKGPDGKLQAIVVRIGKARRLKEQPVE